MVITKLNIVTVVWYSIIVFPEKLYPIVSGFFMELSFLKTEFACYYELHVFSGTSFGRSAAL